MNALEYVHDVCGENEREPLKTEEGGSPSSSRESATWQGTRVDADVQQSNEAASMSAGSVRMSTQLLQPALSPVLTGHSSQESRIFPTASQSMEWDGIQPLQDPDCIVDFFVLDLYQ